MKVNMKIRNLSFSFCVCVCVCVGGGGGGGEVNFEGGNRKEQI